MDADLDDLKYFIDKYNRLLEKYGPAAAEKTRQQADIMASILALHGKME